MKIRVLYNPDKTIRTLSPESKKRKPKESETAHLDRYHKEMKRKEPELKDLPYDDFNVGDMPGGDSEKWRGAKGKGVWIDSKVRTDAEKRQVVEDELDAELAKPDGDALKAMRLMRTLDKNNY